MLTRILVGVIAAPLFLAALVAAPPVWVAALLAAMSAVGAYELLHATQAAPRPGVYVLTVCAALLVPFTILSGVDRWALWVVALLLLCGLFFLAILEYEKEKHLTAEQILYCLFGGVVIPAFLSSLLRLRLLEGGAFAVLLPVVAAFSTDTGAYFTGVFFGRHKGVTRVSPHKSAEGFAGGLVWGVGFLMLYGLILGRWFAVTPDYARLALYGLVGGLVTELGDLAFSLIKRQFGVKDYGKLLPGHGGILDRFDSMSFAAPAMWILMTVLPAI